MFIQSPASFSPPCSALRRASCSLPLFGVVSLSRGNDKVAERVNFSGCQVHHDTSYREGDGEEVGGGESVREWREREREGEGQGDMDTEADTERGESHSKRQRERMGD